MHLQRLFICDDPLQQMMGIHSTEEGGFWVNKIIGMGELTEGKNSTGLCVEVQHLMPHFNINLPIRTNFNWERFTEQTPKISTSWKLGEGLVGLRMENEQETINYIKTNLK